MKGKVVTGSRKRCTTTEKPAAKDTNASDVDGGYQEYSTQKPDSGTLHKWKTTTPFVPFPDTTSEPINTISEQRTKKFTGPLGCLVNGNFFPPGASISEGYDESSDWCYGEYCDRYGEVINWDTWNCKGKLSSTGGRKILI